MIASFFYKLRVLRQKADEIRSALGYGKCPHGHGSNNQERASGSKSPQCRGSHCSVGGNCSLQS